MSLIFFPMSIGFMSHVNFKKMPCRPVEYFKGQGPQTSVSPLNGNVAVFCQTVAKHVEEIIIKLPTWEDVCKQTTEASPCT